MKITYQYLCSLDWKLYVEDFNSTWNYSSENNDYIFYIQCNPINKFFKKYLSISFYVGDKKSNTCILIKNTDDLHKLYDALTRETIDIREKMLKEVDLR